MRAAAPDRLRRPEVGWAEVFPEADAEAAEQVEIDLKYAGYIARDAVRQAQARELEGVSLEGLDYANIAALSMEARERLAAAQPATLGAAARLPGVTPAAVQALTMVLVRGRHDGAAIPGGKR